ncbi:MAG: AMP-binding protein, partial [Pseudomonadota bacterium]
MSNALYDALFAPHVGNEAVFLECDDGTSISYDAFLKRAAQVAQVLLAAGVSPGDRVVVQAPKLADTIALYAACVQVGAVYLPLNTAYTQAELDYFVGDATPTLLVCDVKDAGDFETLAAKFGAALHTLGGGGSLSAASDTMGTSCDVVSRASDDLAALLYTSGTTGRSKGAMLSHNNLLSNARTLQEYWQITSDDRLIHALPIFHTHGLFVALNTALLAGATVRFMEVFNLDAILEE